MMHDPLEDFVGTVMWVLIWLCFYGGCVIAAAGAFVLGGLCGILVS